MFDENDLSIHDIRRRDHSFFVLLLQLKDGQKSIGQLVNVDLRLEDQYGVGNT